MKTGGYMTDNPEMLVTIEVLHNSYKIFPYKWSRYDRELKGMSGTSPKLDKMFMKYDTHFHRYKLTMNIYDKKTKTLTLPIGVDLKLIEQKLTDDFVNFTVKDKKDDVIKTRPANANLSPKYTIRDVYQARSIDFLTSENLFHAKMLALATGRGKTFCAITAAFRLKLPTLFISPTLSDQWVERLEQYTNCNRKNGGLILLRGTDSIDKIVKGKAKPHIYEAAFYVTTPLTLSNYITKFGNLDEFGNILGIGIKCFDEYHQMFAANVYVDMNMNTEHTYYLTATPQRSDYSEKKIFKTITEQIPVYGFESFKANDHYNIRCINYDTRPEEYEKLKCYTSKGLSPVLYWNYIFRNEWRIMYILGIVKYILDKLIENDPDTKVLIYLAKIDQLLLAKKWFECIYEPQGLNVGNYTSDTDKKSKRGEIDKNIIFTTIGSGGVGLDVGNLQAIFSLIPFSSPVVSNQMLGRLRPLPDKEVYFYDFRDTGFETMLLQREKRISNIKGKIKTQLEKTFEWSDIKSYIQN